MGDLDMGYIKNRIENLFPTKKNPLPLEKRVSIYLPEEDYDWAVKFCTLLMEREDFLQIKKEIRLFEISLLQKYHDIFLKRIEAGVSGDEFSLFVKDVNFIKTSASSCSFSTVNFGVLDYYKSSIQINEMESLYNSLFFFLHQEDNPFLMEAERRFYNQVNEKLVDSDLLFVYSTEKECLSQYMYNFCINGYSSFCRKKELGQTRDLNYHKRDCQNNFYFKEYQKKR